MSVCIVGSGPAGLYTARALLKRTDLKIDIFEKMAEPFGLVRWGVAPDHIIKKGDKLQEYQRILADSRVSLRLNHNVTSLSGLLPNYKHIVLATGLQASRRSGVRGERTCPRVVTSMDFAFWYNGHPQPFTPPTMPKHGSRVMVVGHGNVAIDIARMLVQPLEVLRALPRLNKNFFDWRSSFDDVHVDVVGRGEFGLGRISQSYLEEIANIKFCRTYVDPYPGHVTGSNERLNRNFHILKDLVFSKYKTKLDVNTVQLRYNYAPVEYRTDGDRVVVESGDQGGKYDLVIQSVGFETATDLFIPDPKVHRVGWAAHGARGTISSNIEVAEKLVDSMGYGEVGGGDFGKV
jgi:hypothetical protein